MKKKIWFLCVLLLLVCIGSANSEERIMFAAGDSSQNAVAVTAWNTEHVVDVQDVDAQHWITFTTGNKDEWVHIKVINYSILAGKNSMGWNSEGVNYELYSPMGEILVSNRAFNTQGEKVEAYSTVKLEKNTEYRMKFWVRGSSKGMFSFELLTWEDLLGETRDHSYPIAPGEGIKRWRMSGWGDVDYIALGTADYDRQASFYLKNFEFNTYYFKMSLYDSFGIKVDSKVCEKGKTAILKSTLKKGETYYLEIKVDDKNHWYGYYDFAWCTHEAHLPSGDIQVVNEASCTQTGMESDYCLICNEPTNQRELPARGHVPGNAVIVQEATCIQVGKQETRCVECHAVLNSVELPVTSHASGKMSVVKNATCTEAGLNEQHCVVCNITLSTEAPGALGHTPGAWVDTLAATCTAEGVRTQYCEVCKAVLATEAVPAHGHRAMDWQVTREAACLQSGLKEKKCSDCGVTLESEQINALGHSYTEWETLTEATKEQEGEKRRHCINCGDTQFEKIEKLPKVLGIF